MSISSLPSLTLFYPRSISTRPSPENPDSPVQGCWSGGCELLRDAIESLPPPPRYLTPNSKEALIANHVNFRFVLDTPVGDSRHYSSSVTLPSTHELGCCPTSNGATTAQYAAGTIDIEAWLTPTKQQTHPQNTRGSPTGLQSVKFFPSRFRLPARAVRSGGPHAAETRWRATTE